MKGSLAIATVGEERNHFYHAACRCGEVQECVLLGLHTTMRNKYAAIVGSLKVVQSGATLPICHRRTDGVL